MQIGNHVGRPIFIRNGHHGSRAHAEDPGEPQQRISPDCPVAAAHRCHLARVAPEIAETIRRVLKGSGRSRLPAPACHLAPLSDRDRTVRQYRRAAFRFSRGGYSLAAKRLMSRNFSRCAPLLCWVSIKELSMSVRWIGCALFVALFPTTPARAEDPPTTADVEITGHIVRPEKIDPVKLTSPS